MENQNEKIKERFDALFSEWEKIIDDPKIRISSRPWDYINNQPYKAIVNLGEEALPFIMEKLEQGVFFLNQAVLDITGVKIERIMGKEKRFPSEQEKSRLLIDWWNAQNK